MVVRWSQELLQQSKHTRAVGGEDRAGVEVEEAIMTANVMDAAGLAYAFDVRSQGTVPLPVAPERILSRPPIGRTCESFFFGLHLSQVTIRPLR